MTDNKETKQAPAVEAGALTITEEPRDGNWYEFNVNGHHGVIRVVARMDGEDDDLPLGNQIRAFLLSGSALIDERDAAVMRTHMQAFCIQQCAAHIGPDTATTLYGLPKAVKRIVQERDEARAALARASEPAAGEPVPAGWKLAPVEPTKKMIFEAQRYVWVAEEDANEVGIWRSMIAAAPDPSQEPTRCHLCDNTGDIHDATGEWRGECPYCAAPQPASEQQAARGLSGEQVEAIMEQAQVFASAWSLVGGVFDHGNALETAEQEKENLRALLAAKGDGHE